MKNSLHIDSISQVHRYFGLEPPRHPLVSVLGAFEPRQLDSLAGMTVVSDLYSISLKAGIAGHCLYGRNTYDYQDGTLVFIAPGQAIRYSAAEGIPDAAQSWTLLFHPDLIRRSELGKTIHSYSFFSYDANEALHLSALEKDTLRQLVDMIRTEYLQNIDRHSQELIVSNIKLLLDYCTRYYDRQFFTRTNLNKDIANQFEQVLRDYYATNQQETLGLPSVAYCGSVMHMSPYYLSDLLKKETGRSASDHIHFFVLERAKSSLLGSNRSVSEIAYDLGFAYPQHFSKLFRTKTGLSPKDYRKLN